MPTQHSGQWRDAPLHELTVRLAGVLAELGILEVHLRLANGAVKLLQAGRDDLVGAIHDAVIAGPVAMDARRLPLAISFNIDPSGVTWRTSDLSAATALANAGR